MGLVAKDAVGSGQHPFFNPENHANDLALIIEPRTVRKDVPGKYGARDQITARVTVFRSKDSLEQGKPTSIDTYVVNSPRGVVAQLEEELAKDPAVALVAVVRPYKPKNGGKDTWVLRLPQDKDYDLAVSYYAKREADLIKAIAEAPGFEEE